MKSVFAAHESLNLTIRCRVNFIAGTVIMLDVATPAIAAQTRCLEHHLPEDCPSSVGLICRECYARLQHDPPRGPCRSFWESQPVLNNGDPCSVFALVWDDYQIRSLHPTTTWEDVERMAKEVLSTQY